MSSIPYLGSKISLISKSEIRYEGILYTIDTKESTVALAKVRSYGTEDRPTDQPVAPRDDIYEYIIFRASDIKDLHVCEPPKPQDTSLGGLPNDPAIVEHSAPVGMGASFPSATSSFSQHPASVQSGVFGPIGALPSYQPYRSTIEPMASRASVESASSPRSESSSPSPRSQQSPPIFPSNSQTSPKQPVETKKQPRTHFRKKPQHYRSSGVAAQSSIPPRRQARQNNAGQATGGGNWRGGHRGYSHNRAHAADRLQFSSDYDFEQANAEFQELEVKLAKTKISDDKKEGDSESQDNGSSARKQVQDEENQSRYYDKSKSFFDSISCEASEKLKANQPRHDWNQERKMNAETFGVGGGYGRRNGWRGRSRGYYSGSGGYSPAWRGDYRRRGGNPGGRGGGGGGDGWHTNRRRGSWDPSQHAPRRGAPVTMPVQPLPRVQPVEPSNINNHNQQVRGEHWH